MLCKRCGKPIVIDGKELDQREGDESLPSSRRTSTQPARSPRVSRPTHPTAGTAARPPSATASVPASRSGTSRPTTATGPGPASTAAGRSSGVPSAPARPLASPPRPASSPPRPRPSSPSASPEWIVAVNDRDPTQMATSQLVELYALSAVHADTAVWRTDDPTRRTPFDFPELAAALRARGLKPHSRSAPELPNFGEVSHDDPTVVATPGFGRAALPTYNESAFDEATVIAPAPIKELDGDSEPPAEPTLFMSTEALLSQASRYDDTGLGVARLPDDPAFVGRGSAAPADTEHPTRRIPLDQLPVDPRPPSQPQHPLPAGATPPAAGLPLAPPPGAPLAAAPGVPPAAPPAAFAALVPPPAPVPSFGDAALDPTQPPRRRHAGLWIFLIALLTLIAAVAAVYAYNRALLVRAVPQLGQLAPGLFPTTSPPAPPSVVPAPPLPTVTPGSSPHAGAVSANAKGTPSSAPPSPFQRETAVAVLQSTVPRAKECFDPEAKVYGGTVIVTFVPSGRVSNVSLHGQLEGTEVGTCVAGMFRGIHIPPFTGDPIPIAQPLALTP